MKWNKFMLDQETQGTVQPHGSHVARPDPTRWRWTIPVGAAGIILLVLMAYYPLRGAHFIWDDELWLLKNPVVQHWGKLLLAWVNLGQDAQYYPMVFTAFSIEFHLWGFTPIWYHLVNILLQAVDALLLWLVLARLRIPGAWLAAAIFAIHPVQVETVGWITEIKNLLSGAFYLAATLIFVRVASLDKPDTHSETITDTYYSRAYWWATALFVMALTTKTAGLTLPVVLLVLIWWKRGKISLRDVQAVVPWLFIAGVFAWITVHVERTASGARGHPWDFSLHQRILFAGRAWWFYPGKLIWPIPLIEVYPRWNLKTLGGWHWIYPLAAAAVVTTLWLFKKRMGPGPIAAVLIYTLIIGPVLGFISFYTMLYTFVADHYQYLACIPLIVLAAAGLWRLSDLAGKRAPLVYGGCSAVILLSLGVLTYAQSENYKSSAVLWGHALAYNPNSGEVNMGYGEGLRVIGDRFHNKMLHEQSLHYLRKANRLLPDNLYIHEALALAYQDLAHYRMARWYWLRVLDRSPEYISAWRHLAWCLERLHHYNLAIKAYRHVVHLDPEDLGSSLELAGLYLLKGNKILAERAYQHVVNMSPAFAKIPLRLPPWLEHTPKTAASSATPQSPQMESPPAVKK